MGKFKTPFRVNDGIIVDAEGRKVKLWGVNYYAPFNHNFYNIEELGKDHSVAIDEDIRHFKLMGVDLVRMHLYEREITDRNGNIVENKNMAVLDYLIDQCEKNDIYLMICPTVWWNTVNNQIMQERFYAYWWIDAQEAFGFTNFYSCDAMLWDPEAIACQKRYFEGLLSRPSTVSGRRLGDHANIVVFELFNEPRYPLRSRVEREPVLNQESMMEATLSRGSQRQKFIQRWREFQTQHPDVTDEDQCFSLFRADVVRNYCNQLWPVVDQYFKQGVVKAQFSHYDGIVPEDLREVFEDSAIEAVTICTYLNASASFDSDNVDAANHLQLAQEWESRFAGKRTKSKLATISYEFDATGTQNGYPLAAIAALYAKYDIQIAAYFTYTPAAVAAWNPGWLVHFMNLAHTPSRCAGFAAAGDIFRNHEPGDAIEMSENSWRGSDYVIEREHDLVVYQAGTTFRYSNSNDWEIDATRLTEVSGRGASRFAESDANGCYFLHRLSGNTWRLSLFPAQRYLCEPGRGKAYRPMANRYVNCLKEPPVSQLQERAIEFQLKTNRIKHCQNLATGIECSVDKAGNICVPAGEYLLEVDA